MKTLPRFLGLLLVMVLLPGLLASCVPPFPKLDPGHAAYVIEKDGDAAYLYGAVSHGESGGETRFYDAQGNLVGSVPTDRIKLLLQNGD